MTKKKVTAPLTYNPGKGRPKEHLAYLNYQEMQALKRLNGNNQERGPRGLPSFPPAGAMSGGSAKSPASTSKSAGAGSRPSSGGPGGGMMGGSGSGGPSRTSPSSGRGDVGGRDSGTRDSVGANRPSSSGVSRGDVAGRDGGIRNVAGANTPDKSAINSANRTNTLSAQKSPAFKADTGRTVNVGPMGSPVKVGAPASRPSIPKATVQSPMAGQGASFASPLDARIENFQRINDARLKSGALGPEGVPSVSKIAAENARRLNAARMAQQYSQYRSPPRGYPAAPQGVYGPRAGVGTGYLGTADMPGMITTGMTSPYSGTINPRFNAAQTLMAYEAEKRVPGKIQDRVSPTERFRPAPTTPSGRIATPGLISYPNLDRPMTNEEAIKQYSSFRNPTAVPVSRPRTISVPSPEQSLYTGAGQFGVPKRGKIQDRINVVPSPEQSLYKGRPAIRGLDAPPYAYSEKVLDVENIMSDAGIKKNIPGYTAPAVVSGGIGDISPQYPNTPPPGLSARSPAFDPSRLVAYDSPFGPELYGAAGSEIERSLLGGAPTPNFQNVSPFSPESRPYNISLPETSENVRTSSLAMTNPTIGETQTFEGRPYTLSRKERADMDALYNERMSLENTAEGVPGAETPSEDFVDGESASPSQESASPSQDITLSPEAEQAQAEAQKLANTTRKGAQAILNAAIGPPVGTIVGQGLKYLDKQVQKLVDVYQSAGMSERKVMEEKYPNLIARADEMGINSYYGMDSYYAWSEKSGLRGPPNREGGGDNSGIASLGTRPRGDETTTPRPDTPDTPSTTPGRRPDIYYMWDLGINIPSPSDPNYNQYQTYLAERLVAQRAMGYV